MTDQDTAVSYSEGKKSLASISSPCNITINGTVYHLHPNQPDGDNALCYPNTTYDSQGAAMYAVVVIALFATGIGIFIGMMSFKKKKFDEWDKQAGVYLSGYYDRKYVYERNKLSSHAKSVAVPHLGILKLISSMGMHQTAPPKNNSTLEMKEIKSRKINSNDYESPLSSHCSYPGVEAVESALPDDERYGLLFETVREEKLDYCRQEQRRSLVLHDYMVDHVTDYVTYSNELSTREG